MLPENPRERIGLAVAATLLLGFGVAAWATGQTQSPPVVSTPPTPNRETAREVPDAIPVELLQPAPEPPVPDQPRTAKTAIVVHVGGTVQHPGVYSLPPGSRLQRAIHAAGGFAPGADRDGVNLATPLEDADQVVVPTLVAEDDQPSSNPKLAGKSDSPPRTVNRGRVLGKQPIPTKAPKAPAKRKFSQPGDGTVALNTADSEALQQLPGVGKATAQRILAARQEKGRFERLEDLAEVKGIGAKRLEKLRPFLKLE